MASPEPNRDIFAFSREQMILLNNFPIWNKVFRTRYGEQLDEDSELFKQLDFLTNHCPGEDEQAKINFICSIIAYNFGQVSRSASNCANIVIGSMGMDAQGATLENMSSILFGCMCEAIFRNKYSNNIEAAAKTIARRNKRYPSMLKPPRDTLPYGRGNPTIYTMQELGQETFQGLPAFDQGDTCDFFVAFEKLANTKGIIEPRRKKAFLGNLMPTYPNIPNSISKKIDAIFEASEKSQACYTSTKNEIIHAFLAPRYQLGKNILAFSPRLNMNFEENEMQFTSMFPADESAATNFLAAPIFMRAWLKATTPWTDAAMEILDMKIGELTPSELWVKMLLLSPKEESSNPSFLLRQCWLNKLDPKIKARILPMEDASMELWLIKADAIFEELKNGVDSEFATETAWHSNTIYEYYARQNFHANLCNLAHTRCTGRRVHPQVRINDISPSINLAEPDEETNGPAIPNLLD